VADGWCWFILREEYCWLVAGGWFVLREKYCWLVVDKPNEQGVTIVRKHEGRRRVHGGAGLSGGHYVNGQPPGSLKFAGRIQALKMDKQTFTLEFDGLILRSARYAMSNLQLTKRVIF
jgi:hypothetical protein